MGCKHFSQIYSCSQLCDITCNFAIIKLIENYDAIIRFFYRIRKSYSFIIMHVFVLISCVLMVV